MPLPGEQRSVFRPSREAQYFKRALFAIINFLFAITIHVRVNQELIKNKQRKLFQLFFAHNEVQLKSWNGKGENILVS